MLDNGVDKGGESGLVAKGAAVDGIKDLLQLWVELVVAVVVGVTEVFNVFSEVAEQKDVLIAGFAGDFDLQCC